MILVTLTLPTIANFRCNRLINIKSITRKSLFQTIVALNQLLDLQCSSHHSRSLLKSHKSPLKYIPMEAVLLLRIPSFLDELPKIVKTSLSTKGTEVMLTSFQTNRLMPSHLSFKTLFKTIVLSGLF
jgi:hypothetical protein